MATRLESVSGFHLLLSLMMFTATQMIWFSIGSTAPRPIRSIFQYDNKVICPSSEVNGSWAYSGSCNYEESYNPYNGYNSYPDNRNKQRKEINWNNATSIDIGFQLDYAHPNLEKLTVLLTGLSSSSWDNRPWDDNSACNLTTDFTMQAKIGYAFRYEDDNKIDWHLIATTSVTNQSLDCYFTERINQCSFTCKDLPMLELQSLHYPELLLNIRVTTLNEGSLKIFKGASLESISANEAFSQLWWIMKTVFTVVIFEAILLYRKQLKKVPGEASLVERMIMVLAITLQLYNIPLEWLTLFFNIPFFQMLNGIRKDILYATLMIFWLIFTKEHIQDSGKAPNAFRSYRISITLITLGCIASFTPTLVDSAFHSLNPFYSLWSTYLGTKLNFVYVIVISILALVYLFYLMWTIRKVYTNPYTKSLFAVKRSEVPAKSPDSSERYQCCSMFNGLIEISLSSAPRKLNFSTSCRHTCIVILTGLCATLTVIDFVVRRVTTDQWRWNRNTGDYMPLGQFYTGVYGLWNVYAVALMYLYSPVPRLPLNDILNSEENNDDDDELCC